MFVSKLCYLSIVHYWFCVSAFLRGKTFCGTINKRGMIVFNCFLLEFCKELTIFCNLYQCR